MRLVYKANQNVFRRLRLASEALLITEGDKAGPLLIEMDKVHIRQVKDAFRTEGATIASGPWRPWTERYAAWRQRNRSLFGMSMMRLKGPYRGREPDQLYRKATQPSHRDHIRRYSPPFTYVFGLRDDAASYHQEGRPPLSIRSVVDKTDADLTQFRSALRAWYTKRREQVFRALRAR